MVSEASARRQRDFSHSIYLCAPDTVPDMVLGLLSPFPPSLFPEELTYIPPLGHAKRRRNKSCKKTRGEKRKNEENNEKKKAKNEKNEGREKEAACRLEAGGTKTVQS